MSLITQSLGSVVPLAMFIIDDLVAQFTSDPILILIDADFDVDA